MTLHVAQNQLKFSIQLISNPTTGYRWRLCEENDKKNIVLVSHTYHAPTHSLMGASGFEQWVFKKTLAENLSSKKITLCFAYGRSWELQPVKKILLDVVFGSD
ncbi:MAG: hypothetical protein K0R24_675 [Gammaproteobacteria bacterium]|nr:hypothetical protein [Gammaproteobacteria bacterium]